MKKLVIGRRDFLTWAAYAGPVVYLTGCGGLSSGSAGSASTFETVPTFGAPAEQAFACSASSSCKPLVMLYSYSDGSLTPTMSSLNAQLYNVSTAPDRFSDGELCYAFNGSTSLATVQSGVASVLSGAFALSFWFNSKDATHTQALAIGNGTTAVASIEFNNVLGFGIYWSNYAQYTLGGGALGQFTDGSWHHFLLQFDGGELSAFIDGAEQGSASASALSGANDLYIGGNMGSGFDGELDDVRIHNRTFEAAYIPQLVYAWTQAKPLTRNDSLLAYYPFNGNAVNENGRGFDGTLYNVTPTADRFGNANSAYAFDGSTSYIELPTALGPVPNPALAFWVQSTVATPMTAYSITKGAIPSAANLNFVFNDGSALSVNMVGAQSTSIAFGAPGDLTDGNWHFIFLQCSGGDTYQLFVDGTSVGAMTNDSPLMTSDSVIRFGVSSGVISSAQSFWSGALDDAQIYSISGNGSFTPEQIAALMQLQFLPRDGAGVLVFQNKAWLLGGWNPSLEVPTNNQVWSTSDGANWDFVGYAPWERRHMAGWLVYNDRMWVVGGDSNSGHYQNDVWSSADGITWVEETATVPWANRALTITTVFNDMMWLMGGEQVDLGSTVATDAAVYNDVYSSSDGKTWSLVSPHAGWSPRGQIIGNVVFDGKMWVIGGGTYNQRTYLNDVWNSSDGVNWNLVTANAQWAPRQYQDIAVFAGKIWVLAGGTAANDGGSTDVWYSSDGKVWTNLADTPWIYRHAASVFVFNNALWFGCGSSAAAYNDIWKLTYAA